MKTKRKKSLADKRLRLIRDVLELCGDGELMELVKQGKPFERTLIAETFHEWAGQLTDFKQRPILYECASMLWLTRSQKEAAIRFFEFHAKNPDVSGEEKKIDIGCGWIIAAAMSMLPEISRQSWAMAAYRDREDMDANYVNDARARESLNKWRGLIDSNTL